MNLQAIEAINSLKVVDWSCSAGDCEYVLVKDTPESRKILLDAGFTVQQLSRPEVKPDPSSETLEVSYLARDAGADFFNPDTGFSIESND